MESANFKCCYCKNVITGIKENFSHLQCLCKVVSVDTMKACVEQSCSAIPS